MICVSIGRGRHKHLIAEHARMVEQGAELVELRLDYIVRAINLKRILADRPGPVIVTCRREKDGGKWSGSEAERQMVLRTAIAEQVDYVDIEEDIAGSIPRYGKTKRIVSLHDFEKTPEDLPALQRRMQALDADIVKIATMANNPHDNVRMLQLMEQSAEVPTIGICMGDMGIPTRILAGKYGAPFTYAAFTQERTLAPGQISFRQMVDVYDYPHINAETEVLWRHRRSDWTQSQPLYPQCGLPIPFPQQGLSAVSCSGGTIAAVHPGLSCVGDSRAECDDPPQRSGHGLLHEN